MKLMSSLGWWDAPIDTVRNFAKLRDGICHLVESGFQLHLMCQEMSRIKSIIRDLISRSGRLHRVEDAYDDLLEPFAVFTTYKRVPYCHSKYEQVIHSIRASTI
jgi:hypothetical protein